MKKIIFFIFIFSLLTNSVFAAEAKVGEPAPDFVLTDTHHAEHTLTEYKGKFVVLEWTNPDCPFVRKHYDKSGNMQKLQKEYTAKGVIWLSINSSAPGKQGNYPLERLNQIMKEKGSAPTALLLDSDGEIGKMYGAKTTPHLFIVNPEGILVYEGAIDDKPTPDPNDIKTAKNYVKTALDEAMSGKPVATSSSQPYGCSVKYA